MAHVRAIRHVVVDAGRGLPRLDNYIFVHVL